MSPRKIKKIVNQALWLSTLFILTPNIKIIRVYPPPWVLVPFSLLPISKLVTVYLKSTVLSRQGSQQEDDYMNKSRIVRTYNRNQPNVKSKGYDLLYLTWYLRVKPKMYQLFWTYFKEVLRTPYKLFYKLQMSYSTLIMDSMVWCGGATRGFLWTRG